MRHLAYAVMRQHEDADVALQYRRQATMLDMAQQSANLLELPDEEIANAIYLSHQRALYFTPTQGNT